MATRLEKMNAVREHYVAEIERACELHYDQQDIEQQADRIIRAAQIVQAIDIALSSDQSSEVFRV